MTTETETTQVEPLAENTTTNNESKDQSIVLKDLFDIVKTEENKKFLKKKGLSSISDIDKLIKTAINQEALIGKRLDQSLESPIMQDLIKDKFVMTEVSQEELSDIKINILENESLNHLSDDSKELILKDFSEKEKAFKEDIKKYSLTKKQAMGMLESFNKNYLNQINEQNEKIKNSEQELEALENEWGVNKEINYKNISKAIKENDELKHLSLQFPQLTTNKNFLKFVLDSTNTINKKDSVPFSKTDNDKPLSQYEQTAMAIMEKNQNKYIKTK